jgi:hypothetical protein
VAVDSLGVDRDHHCLSSIVTEKEENGRKEGKTALLA